MEGGMLVEDDRKYGPENVVAGSRRRRKVMDAAI